MNSLAAQTWLILRNDLRLFWRDLRSGKARMFSGTALMIVLFVLFQGVAILAFYALRTPPPLIAETVIWFFVAFVMLGASVNNAVTVLFERADFDLLLSSPVSPAAILLARIMAMIATAAVSIGIFFVPVLNGVIIGVSRHYVFAYVVWLFLAAIATCGGIGLTLLLVRWLGPRRARVWAQVIGAVLGALIYIAFQLQNMVHAELRESIAGTLGGFFQHPLAGFVARAGRGEWLPLGALAVLAAAAVWTTVRLLGRIFVSGIQESSVVRPQPRRGREFHFAEGLVRATYRKDVRLIIRDPLLLSRVLPSVFFLVPALLPLARVGHAGAVGVLGPFMVIMADMLSSQLTAIAASGEEGWDLIRLSPASTAALRVAKIAAGMALPIALAVVVGIVVSLLGHPGLAAFALVTSIVTAAGSCWLEVAVMQPTPRKDLIQRTNRKRRLPSPVRMIAGLFFIGGGTASVAAAAANYWAIAAIGFVVVLLTAIGCFTMIEMKDIEFEASGSSAT